MIFSGIQWAMQRGAQGAQVVSMSLGFDFPGLVKELVDSGWPTELATSVALEGYRGNLRMFDALMEMARARAVFGESPVIVAAAGNESRRQVNARFEIAASLPAAAKGVISVGALRMAAGGKLGIADFSNTFPQVSAPGIGRHRKSCRPRSCASGCGASAFEERPERLGVVHHPLHAGHVLGQDTQRTLD